MKQAVWYSDFENHDKLNSPKKSELAGTLVQIQDYNPASHTLKVVDAITKKPLIDKVDTISDIKRSKPFEQENNKVLKTLPAPDAPIVEVNDTEASIRGSGDNGFFSSREFGNIIKGPISISAQPHEVRVSGLFTLHPLLTSGFPSTMVTPIPVLQWSLPSGAMLGPIAKEVALMATLIGAF